MKLNKKIIVIISAAIVLAVALAVIFTIKSPGSEPAPVVKSEETPVPEPEPVKPEIKNVEIRETGRVEINVNYPEFKNLASSTTEETLNKLLKGKFEGEVVNFKSEADKEAAPELSISSSLSVGFETVLFTENAVSLKFEHSEFIAGMAHPNTYYTVFNYDFKNGKEIVLSDLFNQKSGYLKSLSEHVMVILKKQLATDGYYDKEMVKQGTEPKATNFSLFVFDSEKLILIFNTPQVAPYVAGARFVEMAFSEFEDINNESELLGRIIPPPPSAEDELSRLKKETGLAFGDAADANFNWMTKSGDGIKAKILGGNKISGENFLKVDYEKVIEFFTKSGYEEDLNNAADGVRGTQSGYVKKDIACISSSMFMEMKQDESGISVPASDKRIIEVSCGSWSAE
ncbi:MAG: DUF3298 domain-containing protein [Patescibacteria group bacterium]